MTEFYGSEEDMSGTVMSQKQLGAWIDYDHKPTAVEVAEGVQELLRPVLNDVRMAVVIRDVRVILREEDEERRNTIDDPLNNVYVPKDRWGHWTLGLKVTGYFGEGIPEPRTTLKEGVTPEPIKVFASGGGDA